MSKAEFYIERIIIAYKLAISQRDAATSEQSRATLENVIEKIRADWVDWTGGDADELYEKAFGRPKQP